MNPLYCRFPVLSMVSRGYPPKRWRRSFLLFMALAIYVCLPRIAEGQTPALIYRANDDQNLQQIRILPLNGEESYAIAEGYYERQPGLSVQDGKVYWSGWSESGPTLMKANLDGTNVEAITPLDDSCRGLDTSSTHIFVAGAWDILRASVNGSSITRIISNAEFMEVPGAEGYIYTHDLSYYGGHVYYLASGTYGINLFRSNTDGSDLRFMRWLGNFANLQGMDITSDGIFFSGARDTDGLAEIGIFRCDLDGDNLTLVYDSSANPTTVISDIVCAPEGIYYTGWNPVFSGEGIAFVKYDGTGHRIVPPTFQRGEGIDYLANIALPAKVATPTISFNASGVAGSVLVTLASSTPGATIRYVADTETGHVPTEHYGNIYTGAVYGGGHRNGKSHRGQGGAAGQQHGGSIIRGWSGAIINPFPDANPFGNTPSFRHGPPIRESNAHARGGRFQYAGCHLLLRTIAGGL